MSYFKGPDAGDQLVAKFEEPNVGKAIVHGSGHPSGPKHTWRKEEIELVRLKNARSMVSGLLEGLERDIAKLEAKARP